MIINAYGENIKLYERPVQAEKDKVVYFGKAIQIECFKLKRVPHFIGKCCKIDSSAQFVISLYPRIPINRAYASSISHQR